MRYPKKFCAAFAIAGFFMSFNSHAQDRPPINMIVPFSAGGSTDILARVIGKEIADVMSRPVVIDNKPGAEGAIAARQLKAAKPDGNTMMLVTTSVYAINPAVFSSLPYDSAADFSTIGVIASSPNILLAAENSKYRTIADVIDDAKQRPGEVFYGTGATMHLLNSRLLEELSGVKMASVPYKGSAAVYPDLIGGRLNMMVDQPLSSMSLIETGKLRALAVTSETRWARLPNVPTLSESGYPNFKTTSWWAVLVPAGTPHDVQQKLAGVISEVLKRSTVKEQVVQIGADVSELSWDQSKEYVAAELKSWKQIAERAKVKLD